MLIAPPSKSKDLNCLVNIASCSSIIMVDLIVLLFCHNLYVGPPQYVLSYRMFCMLWDHACSRTCFLFCVGPFPIYFPHILGMGIKLLYINPAFCIDYTLGYTYQHVIRLSSCPGLQLQMPALFYNFQYITVLFLFGNPVIDVDCVLVNRI